MFPRLMRTLLMILVGIGVFTTPGCSSAWPYPTHAELDRSYWVKSDYVPGALYRLREPVFLFRWLDDSRPNLAVIGEHRFSFGCAPQTVRQYQQDGSHRWRAVKAVLPAGTLLRFEGFQFVTEDGLSAFPLATATERESAKLGFFSIGPISNRMSGGETGLNPQYLEAVDPQIRGTAAGFLEVSDIDPRTGLGSVPKPVDEARVEQFMEAQKKAQEEQAAASKEFDEQIKAATQRAQEKKQNRP